MAKRKDAPASLGAIAEALESSDPAVRIGGLTHACAVGLVGRSLAVRVAALLDDADGGVAWNVPRAFQAVGREAIEALDVLMPMLDAKADATRTQRALYCVSVIGSATVPRALAPILALSREPFPIGTAALAALVGLASTEAGGDANEAIAARLLEALASKDYATSSETARALATAPDWLALRTLDDIDARLDEDTRGITLLGELVPRMRERVLTSITRAIAAGGMTAGMVESAIAAIPPPIPDALVRVLIASLAKGSASAALALTTIAPTLPTDAYRTFAIETLVPALATADTLRAFASIARALGSFAPGSGAGIETSMQRFEREIDLPSVLDSWYCVADLARGIGDLADAASAPRAASLLSGALAGSAAKVKIDQNAAIVLQSALRDALAPLAAHAPASARKKTLADRVNAADAKPQKKRTQKLAPIPKARPQRRPPELRALDASQRKSIAGAVTRGRAIASMALALTARSTSDRIASAVDAAVVELRTRRQRDARRAGHSGRDLGAAYGDALVRGMKWRWQTWTEGDHVTFAVVSPKRTHAVLPIETVLRQLKPSAEVTLLLLFRMIEAGELAAGSGPGPAVLG